MKCAVDRIRSLCIQLQLEALWLRAFMKLNPGKFLRGPNQEVLDLHLTKVSSKTNPWSMVEGNVIPHARLEVRLKPAMRIPNVRVRSSGSFTSLMRDY